LWRGGEKHPLPNLPCGIRSPFHSRRGTCDKDSGKGEAIWGQQLRGEGGDSEGGIWGKKKGTRIPTFYLIRGENDMKEERERAYLAFLDTITETEKKGFALPFAMTTSRQEKKRKKNGPKGEKGKDLTGCLGSDLYEKRR